MVKIPIWDVHMSNFYQQQAQLLVIKVQTWSLFLILFGFPQTT